ncbi:MAG: hypothetical protein ACI3Y2_04690 [Candidatus Egerieousia sp.]
MESIIEDLVNHIGDNMPCLKVVDEDYGQLEMIDSPDRDTYPLTFPAVLIDAPQVSWDNIGGLDQKGFATVKVKLVIDCYDDTHYTSGAVEKISEREYMRRELHRLLQGHRPGDHSALIRTTSSFYTVNHGIKVYEATYTTELTEVIPDNTRKPGKVKIIINKS